MIFKLIDMKSNKVDFISITSNCKISVIGNTIECRVIANTAYHNEYILFKFKVVNDVSIECAIQSRLNHDYSSSYVELEGEYIE